MFLFRTAVITIAAAALVVVAAVALALVPWWTGPGLPAGATRLHIATDSSPRFGCQAAVFLPVRISSTTDRLVLAFVASGEPMPVVWPSGFAAWRADGRAVLAGPYGNVIGREGDVLDDLGGGTGPDGTAYVCGFGTGFAGLVGTAPWLLLAVSAALGAVIIGVPRAMARRHRKPS